MSEVLVTGGLGFIGSHVVAELCNSGFRVVVLDNLSNSKPQVLKGISRVCGYVPEFLQLDIRDSAGLKRAVRGRRIQAVVHLAGLKSVSESVLYPLDYYHNNVMGTMSLLAAMRAFDTEFMVFSSSATVYGKAIDVPLSESAALCPLNPYGRSKLMCENVIADVAGSRARLRYAILRYFNPVGAHSTGFIGEDPSQPPGNLFPRLARVAGGEDGVIKIYGGDYETPDGTGIRDYVHVQDVADAHVRAVQYLVAGNQSVTLNVGTGRGLSVLQAIRHFEGVSGKRIPYEIVGRRDGDVGECFADVSRAERIFGWRARRSIEEMCADAWRWKSSLT